jgi:hypothetical protein
MKAIISQYVIVLPCPLNSVILEGVGVDGANHLRVVTGVDHDVARDIGNAENK